MSIVDATCPGTGAGCTAPPKNIFSEGSEMLNFSCYNKTYIMYLLSIRSFSVLPFILIYVPNFATIFFFFFKQKLMQAMCAMCK